jgi:hypothetical protein
MADVPKSCRMRIASGLHAGVEQVLAGGEHTFGSGTTADFVLLDDGLEPLHFTVRLYDGRARIEALAEPCDVDGIGSLDAGESCECKLPVGIAVGACRVEFTGLTAHNTLPNAFGPSQLLGSVQRHPMPYLVGLTAVVALGIVGARISTWERSPTVRSQTIAAAASPSSRVGAPANAAVRQGDTQVDAGRKPARPRPAPDEVVKALKRELEEAGLLNIAVEAGSGVVAASGTVTPDAAAQWLVLQRRFDERYLGEITLINDVAVQAEQLPALQIEAVWRGPNPHLIIRGEKYPEGSVLESGWAVKHIEAERVVLERHGRRVTIRY